MKRKIILMAVVALAVTGAYVVFAGDPMGGGMRDRGMRGGNMQGRGMMGWDDMTGWDGMMGPMMRSSSLVATSDGGVIVLMGNELSKYDSDLNLLKQVEIKFDWENWQKMMMQHRSMMMQRRNMMMGGQSSSK